MIIKFKFNKLIYSTTMYTRRLLLYSKAVILFTLHSLHNCNDLMSILRKLHRMDHITE